MLTLLDVQQASKPIEVAKDISTTPVDTAQGMSSNAPDLAQKEVAIKPLDTTLCVSSHAPDLTQKEVAIMPVDTAQGMSSNAPDLVQKKVAIQPAPLLQETALPPLQKQEEGQALTATDVCQKPEMGEFPIPLQAKPDDCQDQLAQQSLPQPPLQEQGRQDLTAVEDCQEPEMKMSTIPQSPPHVQGPEDLRPLHDAESPPPPEVGVCNQEGQLLLAPIPVQTSKEADCQDQFAQQLPLQAPAQQQRVRHANGHANMKRKVQCKTVKLYKTSKTFTKVKVVKVASLTYFEELLIRNRAMCLILFLVHIYFVVLVENAPFLGLKSMVFRPNYYFNNVNRGNFTPLFS